jgi:two-component system, OmpR family, response regulator
LRFPDLFHSEQALLEQPMNGVPSHEKHRLIPTHRAVRVLVVNDDRDIVDSIAMFLRLFGHEVEVALGGAAALQAAQAQQPDAVLLDISMPGMDGFQVARKLRVMFRDKPLLIIAITAHGSEEDRRHSAEAGIDLHLVKPADPLEVENLLLDLGRSL